MLIKFYICALIKVALGSEDYFNILTLDAEGVESLVSAYILREVEHFAYNLTRNETLNLKGVPEYSDQRVALKDIFNMMAGASSSSFIVAGLSIASPE
jgi:hypothetical protein